MAVLSLSYYKEALAKIEERIAHTESIYGPGKEKPPKVSWMAWGTARIFLEDYKREANRLRALVECLEREARKTPYQ